MDDGVYYRASAKLLGSYARRTLHSVHLFSADDRGTCEAYRACRDHITKAEPKERLERAWETTRDVLGDDEADVLNRFRSNFHSAAWEIYIRDVFRRAGFQLEKTKPHGPDICVRTSSRRLWIEAVTVKPGDGADRVQSFRDSGARAGALYPIASLLLRIASVISRKLEQIDRWHRENVISTNEPIIVALNHGLIIDSDLHDDGVPAFVKAVLPIGDASFHIDPYQHETSEDFFPTRTYLAKANGTVINTSLFHEPRSRPISALLVARQLVWNLHWSLERDALFLHNPSATTSIARGSVPSRVEMWEDASSLHLDRRAIESDDMVARPLGRPSRTAQAMLERELARIKAMSARDRALLALRLGRRS